MRLRYILFSVLTLLLFVPVCAQVPAGSNIVSRTMLSSDSTKAVEQRVYDNGLGDIVQEVKSYPGSTLPSVVVHHEYDDYRRRTKSWLPVISSSGSGFVNAGTIAFQAQSQYSDTAPFSRTVYDGFLQLQPSAQYKAGAQWHGNDKKVSSAYSEYVGACMFSPADGCMYITSNTAKLLCMQTADEDGSQRMEYTELGGRLMISETSMGKTYYVYNAKGDVAYVIPPVLSAYLVSQYGYDSGNIPDTDEMMQKYAYVYRYDNQRHCIYKKLPGCAPVYYVYDSTGACILTQDGNQRESGVWAYTIPDRFGRPCISGICRNSVSYTAEPLHPQFVYAEYDGSSTQTGGYTVHGMTLSQQTLYTATYYDDYSFIGQHGVPSTLTASTVSGFPVDQSLGRGLKTGTATAVLKNGNVTGYTYSALYYDSRYRVSQVKAKDYLGNTDVTSTVYSYTGKPQDVRIQHTVGSSGSLTENCHYTYDDADRVSSYTVSVSKGIQPASATITYEYDALGRLTKASRPSNAGNVTYSYDLHGWTKGITTDSFREELFYADGPGTPCYNGNISSLKWKNDNYRQKRGYKFAYDNANRLTQATYGEGESITGFGRFNEGVQYEPLTGNVSRIIRYGRNSSNGYGVMDNLTLSYDGYQLTAVSESATDYNANGTFEYKRANGSEYLYNANGSLVADRSRGIAYITYDFNNHPQTIYFTNGNMTKYIYSATGEKLCVESHVAVPNITRPFGVEPTDLPPGQTTHASSTDYLLGGSLIVKNGILVRLLFDGGYAKATPISTSTYGFDFYYYNRDHLGNNREVVNNSGTVQQVTNYYPFGAPYADPAAVMAAALQPYKYNGKELDLMHGLNTYDYGARQYDPILARWDRVDPLAEKYYGISPYAYCADNPVKFIDPDGKVINLFTGALIGITTEYVSQVSSNIVTNGINLSSFTNIDYGDLTIAGIVGAATSGMSTLNASSKIISGGTSFVGEIAKAHYDITNSNGDFSISANNSCKTMNNLIGAGVGKGVGKITGKITSKMPTISKANTNLSNSKLSKIIKRTTPNVSSKTAFNVGKALRPKVNKMMRLSKRITDGVKSSSLQINAAASGAIQGIATDNRDKK